jgi:hypothetical protein
MTRRILYFGLSILISVSLGGYLLSQIDFNALVRTFKHLDYSSLSIYAGMAFTGIVLRTYRYYLLIFPEKIRFGSLILVTMVRNLFVDLLPAKIGSLSYLYLTNRRFGLPFEIAATSFLLAFVFDLIVLFPIFFLAVAASGADTPVFSSFSLISFCIILFIAAVIGLLWLHRVIRYAVILMENIFHFREGDSPGINRIFEKIQLIASDIEALRSQKIRYIKIIITSFFVRIFKYGSLYFLLHSVVAHLDFTLGDLNFSKVFIGILGAELSALFPVQGIAGIGTWESAWALTFRFLGHFDSQVAIISGFGVHLITQLFEYSLGIIGIIILYLPFKKRGTL